MKTQLTKLHSQNEREKLAGFTLMEVLLAFLVFSVAVVSLVEAINLTGLAATENVLESRVRDRMASMLLEVTRNTQSERSSTSVEELDTTVMEDGVEYHVARQRVMNLFNQNNEPVDGIYQVRITARWMESGHPRTATAETWFWPPLFEQQS